MAVPQVSGLSTVAFFQEGCSSGNSRYMYMTDLYFRTLVTVRTMTGGSSVCMFLELCISGSLYLSER